MAGEYDEFGNFIGKIEESDDSETSSSSESEEESEEVAEADDGMDIERVAERMAQQETLTVTEKSALVLHEDKSYYPSNEEVYGKDTQVLVGEEDTQPIEVPIIAPKVDKELHAKTKSKGKKQRHQESYIGFVAGQPTLVRNMCLIGNHAHGKTTFMDYLLGESGRVCDMRLDEQSRGISIKATPVSVLLENEKGKNYLFNVMDAPGHISLVEESVAGMRLSDGVALVVDVIEGLMMGSEKQLLRALAEGLPLVLVLNKIDRLILELHIPPHDAYMKIMHVLSDINTFISKAAYHPSYGKAPRFSPELGNVVFASAKYDYAFTLKSFARIYSEFYPGLEVERFARRLWGQIYYNAESKKFSKEREDDDDQVSFVTFILEPLYKLTALVIQEEGKELNDKLWENAGVRLWKQETKLDADPLLRLAAGRFFRDPSCFVEAVVAHIPSPAESAKVRMPWVYNGVTSPEDPVARSLLSCDASGTLMVNVTKLLFKSDGSGFDALGRVWSGTLHARSQVRVLGEHY
eukprot:TRINITY_DN1506_c0_g2_i1.p1 TRINITY_DN1506_c0_g2~~TRINITY_DN1506_c0_g2_i1.p1  ORF type:complete len:521 (+),score=218.69 TRINITY_DN1506_c0_g2_i1:132-1694(+)